MTNTSIESNLAHQDWKPIIVRKNKSNNFGGSDSKENKVKISNSQLKAKSIEKKAENDTLKHKKITNELRTNIQKARTSKSLTQKQLAAALRMPVQKIQDIESGKAIYNGNDINKIKNYLKVKI